jgi:hypothetical protein
LLLLLHSAATGKVGADVVAPGHQADHQQDDEPYDSKTTAAEAATRLASPILNVAAKTARSPSHKVLRV